MEAQKKSLSSLREAAGFTQTGLAETMGVSQSLVSKWEKDINTANPSNILTLANILDVTLEEIMGQPFSDKSSNPMSAGTPYRNLLKRLKIIQDYFGNLAEKNNSNNSRNTYAILQETLSKFLLKPLVGLSGRYDSGKSTLINELLGNDMLPTSYQPMTSLPVFILHSDLKPDWMKENETVAITSQTNINAFLLSKTGDERIAIGTASLLREFASHKGQEKVEDARMAILFHESPALNLCSFLDLPGYKHSIEDTSLATDFHKEIDLLIYTSPIMGCMDEYDLPLMAEQLNALPSFEQGNPEFPTLGNFVLAITRCGRDEPEETIQQTLTDISNRVYKHYAEDTIKKRSKIIGRQISLDELKYRFIPFSRDVSRRRNRFIDKIQEILNNMLPKIWEAKAHQAIEEIRNTATKNEKQAIDKINQLLENQEQCSGDYEVMKKNMPKIREKIYDAKGDTTDFIKTYSTNSVTEFSKFYESFTLKETLVTLIENQYGNDSKTAAKQIGSYLSERIGGSTNDICIKYAMKLAKRIERSFEELAEDMNSLLPQMVIESGIEKQFGTADIKSFFISGLAGLSTIGALGVWAAIVAAGSNLGAYILVAKISGILSSLGISVGGPALISLVASLGGPLVVGTGIGLIIAVATWGILKLFSPSWQERLAGKLIKGMKKENTLMNYIEKIEEYWDSTLIAVENGFDGIATKMEYELDILRDLTETGPETVQKLEQQLKQHERVLSFFVNMPRL